MARSERSYTDYNFLKKRSQKSFFNSMFSIALTLFFLGLLAVGTLFVHSFSQYIKQSIPMKVFLQEDVVQYDLDQFFAALSSKDYVQRYAYISKEDALKQMQERTGEDVSLVLDGLNPLPAMVEVFVSSEHLNVNELLNIKAELGAMDLVSEIEYKIEQIRKVEKNASSLSLAAILLCLISVFVTLYLVVSTLRMSIYTQRLSIRSMQLIGASRGFIRKPFLLRSLLQGLLAGLLAVVLLILLVFIASQAFLSTNPMNYDSFNTSFIVILGGIVVFGGSLGLIGSYLTVNRYLDKDLNELMS